MVQETSDDSANFDLEDYIEQHNERIARSQAGEQLIDEKTAGESSNKSKKEKLEEDDESNEIKEKKASKKKKSKKTHKVDKILSHINNMDKISYIERSIEFDPQLQKLQIEREEK